jgi:sec-independent protein translocase protein TatC
MAASDSNGEPDLEQPFISHLIELRDRLLRMVVAVFVVFLCLFPFTNSIYTFVATPLMAHLPQGSSMIATEVASPFLTPFKLVLVAAVFVAMPYILHQFWGFVAPGLYRHEKTLVVPLLVSSVLLFYLGILFAYFVVFPLIFAFFTSTAPEGVAVMTDISHYLSFVLTLFFAFGIAFEVPIATILLVWMGVVTPESLVAQRPFIIVGAFVIGMFLTPPDVFSQTLLAVPMWLLFEVGVFSSRILVRRREAAEEEGAEADDAEPAGGGAAAARAATRPAASPTAGEGLVVGADISGGDPFDPERFVPMTPAEMEAELAAIEAAEQVETKPAGQSPEPPSADPVEAKLHRIGLLRNRGDESGARRLLYQVLEEGNEDQRRVARNILEQLDAP